MEKDPRIGYEIKTLDHMIGRYFTNISIKNGMDQVTVMHGWIIGYLYDHPNQDIYQKDIEAAFRITRSTVANIVKLMEKKGYIQRVSVEKDARLKKLVLTEKAKQFQRQNYMDMHNIVETQLTTNISAEDLETFLRILRTMRTNLENGGEMTL